ncbi:hypothetical protein DFH07DRAFT_703628, partial [Mycena maculata]
DGIPSCPTDALEWFTTVYAEVSRCNLGSAFNALLKLFIELEQQYGWVKTGGKGLGTTNRPPQVTAWISAGRGSRGGSMANAIGPTMPALAVFDATWWQWWSGLQPSWRTTDKGNSARFARDRYPAGDVGNWVTLRHSGPNGVLSLVAALYWWG